MSDTPQLNGNLEDLKSGDFTARLEIWFIPANGGKPHKLKEKLFRVQGWMF